MCDTCDMCAVILLDPPTCPDTELAPLRWTSAARGLAARAQRLAWLHERIIIQTGVCFPSCADIASQLASYTSGDDRLVRLVNKHVSDLATAAKDDIADKLGEVLSTMKRARPTPSDADKPAPDASPAAAPAPAPVAVATKEEAKDEARPTTALDVAKALDTLAPAATQTVLDSQLFDEEDDTNATPPGFAEAAVPPVAPVIVARRSSRAPPPPAPAPP